MPTAQMKAVGIWGIAAIIIMGVSAQFEGFPIDWSAPVLEVPLSGWVVALAAGVGGWLKGGGE